MNITDERRVQSSLSFVLSQAGLSLRTDGDDIEIDLRELDLSPSRAETQIKLQTTASLIFQLGSHRRIRALLPSQSAAQHAVASTGLLFALAQHDADLTYQQGPEPMHDGQLELFSEPRFQSLLSERSWKLDFSSSSAEFRQAAMSREMGFVALSPSGFRRHMGVLEPGFLAFVNPHSLPNADAVVSVAGVVAPWLNRRAARKVADTDATVANILELLSEAFENVIQHAFDGTRHPRSLITIGHAHSGTGDQIRLQILDNGIGIPASLAARLGRDDFTVATAKDLIDQVVERHDLLPGARGRGIPRMVEIATESGGRIDITTSGPDGTQILVHSRTNVGAERRRGRAIASMSDKVPVAGTIVTAHLPIVASGE